MRSAKLWLMVPAVALLLTACGSSKAAPDLGYNDPDTLSQAVETKLNNDANSIEGGNIAGLQVAVSTCTPTEVPHQYQCPFEYENNGVPNGISGAITAKVSADGKSWSKVDAYTPNPTSSAPESEAPITPSPTFSAPDSEPSSPLFIHLPGTLDANTPGRSAYKACFDSESSIAQTGANGGQLIYPDASSTAEYRAEYNSATNVVDTDYKDWIDQYGSSLTATYIQYDLATDCASRFSPDLPADQSVAPSAFSAAPGSS